MNNITRICEDALRAANLRLRDLDAIATTVKPGLSMSLKIGLQFGKYLAKISGKPFVPVHHMEAHALTARMLQKVEFPYVVLLVSGGHCLLAIVENVDKFYLLGASETNAPGEIFDKIARKLKLRNIPEFSKLCGGQAIELAASRATNVNQFRFVPMMPRRRDCNFNFGGIYSHCNDYIEQQQQEHKIEGDMLIPDVYNLCAAVQLTTVTHICERTKRAMKFTDALSLIPEEKRTLVVSGGFACNNFLAKGLKIVCEDLGYNFVRTPPKLCTDNGVMIAWNGIEKWNANVDILRDPKEIESVMAHKRAPFGEDWRKEIRKRDLTYEWGKLQKQLIETVLNK